MARVKTGNVTKNRHRRILKLAKGYFGSKHRLYRTAKEQVIHSWDYAFRDRHNKKRDFRKLWITRINAALTGHNLSYSRLIYGLKLAKIDINRKILSELAISDTDAFSELVARAKNVLSK
jgi:large subunit ribosomal protein L20